MLSHIAQITLGGVFCGSLLLIDHLLGNGFMDAMKSAFCKCFCFVKKTIRADYLKSPNAADPGNFNFLVFVIEIVALLCTMLLLNKYNKAIINHTDRVMKEKSQDSLQQNKRRRITNSMEYGPKEVENPFLIKPLNLEVPVMHMAVIDTIGTTRSQPERGDAGDIYNITDSAIISVTSLLDTDFKLKDSISDNDIELNESNAVQFNNNRYLWDVVEEE